MGEDVHPAEIWIAGFLGVIFMLMGMSFAKWAIATLSGQTYNTGAVWSSGPNAGQPVTYFELQGFTGWTDMGIFLFGLSMVLEAAALCLILWRKFRLPAVWMAMLLTGATFILNAFVIVKLFGAGVMPILSLLVVAFAGFMLMRLWTLAKVLSIATPTS